MLRTGVYTMAKKKKQVARKKAKRAATSARKRPAEKRPAGKRPAGKRSAGKQAKADTSIDAILKRFAKERVTNETQVATLRKKREDLEARSAKLREQINRLMDQEKKSRDELAQLDARRDQEVAQLLEQLGVRLQDAAAPRAPAAPHNNRPENGNRDGQNASRGQERRVS